MCTPSAPTPPSLQQQQQQQQQQQEQSDSTVASNSLKTDRLLFSTELPAVLSFCCCFLQSREFSLAKPFSIR
jgi:hypothetical protein